MSLFVNKSFNQCGYEYKRFHYVLFEREFFAPCTFSYDKRTIAFILFALIKLCKR